MFFFTDSQDLRRLIGIVGPVSICENLPFVEPRVPLGISLPARVAIGHSDQLDTIVKRRAHTLTATAASQILKRWHAICLFFRFIS